MAPLGLTRFASVSSTPCQRSQPTQATAVAASAAPIQRTDPDKWPFDMLELLLRKEIAVGGLRENEPAATLVIPASRGGNDRAEEQLTRSATRQTVTSPTLGTFSSLRNVWHHTQCV